MKLLLSTFDTNDLYILKNLLEENGIPAFVHGENTARMMPFAISEPGLWVYLDEQFDEAQKLLDDHEYEVINKVDVDMFYKETQDIVNKPSILNGALLQLGFTVILFMIGLYLLVRVMAWLATR